MSILSKLTKKTLRVALLLSVFTGLVTTSNAATTTLPKNLRGKYVVKNATVTIPPFTSNVTFKKITIPVGKSGLTGLTDATVSKILDKSGAGPGLVVTITSKNLEDVSLSASGTIVTKFGTAIVSPNTTGTGTLTNNGNLTFVLHIEGTFNGQPVSGTQTVILKKQK